MQKDTLSNVCSLRRPNFLSQGLVPPENREEASVLMTGAAILLLHNRPGPEVSALHAAATGNSTLPCPALSASATPHQPARAVTTWGCQCGPPDCEATGSEMWPGAGPSPRCVSKGPAARQSPPCNSPATCLRGEANLISGGLAWQADPIQPRVQKHPRSKGKRERRRPLVWT